MRKVPNLKANKFRIMTGPGATGPDDGNNGAFLVPVGRALVATVIASDGEGWDHVSVSLANRCPTWDELETVRRLFFADDETVMQLHVPVSEHISDHPYCLHLWRPQEGTIPTPPSWMVGPGVGEEAARRLALGPNLITHVPD